MVIHYQSAILLVEDVQRSYRFYRDLLDQEVLIANDLSVHFQGGLSLRQLERASQTVFRRRLKNSNQKQAKHGLLYFETNELEPLWDRLSMDQTCSVYPIRRQRTGQYMFRVYDPDGYMIEIGESMPLVAPPMGTEGISYNQIPRLKCAPREGIEPTTPSSSSSFHQTENSNRFEELMALFDMYG